MPINRCHFDLGIDSEGESWMREIYNYLAGHQDSAYSYQELLSVIRLRFRTKGIEGFDNEADKANFERALDALVWIGAVDTRKIDDTAYYAFLKEFDTSSWEPKVRV
jgi:hypothetical protein